MDWQNSSSTSHIQGKLLTQKQKPHTQTHFSLYRHQTAGITSDRPSNKLCVLRKVCVSTSMHIRFSFFILLSSYLVFVHLPILFHPNHGFDKFLSSVIDFTSPRQASACRLKPLTNWAPSQLNHFYCCSAIVLHVCVCLRVRQRDVAREYAQQL